MCGIAGELRFDEAPDLDALRRMSGALAHRGPDGEGFFYEGPVALAHRRLAILDLFGGGQPMVREGCALVFNGQIYRYRELAEELRARGHVFTTRSDTEVALRAYLEWGEGFVERLDGMFAIGLWDPQHQRLLLARDRAGKKPLHFALQTTAGWPNPESDELPSGPVRRVAFASEIKALVAHGGLPHRSDRVALSRYLAMECVPGSRTAFAEWRKLPPGHLAVVDAQGFRLRRYWELPRAPHSDAETEVTVPNFEALLEGAVVRRLNADVPVGIFLSGGLDSTAVAALAVRHHAQISSFSIGFTEQSFDESRYARLVAQRLGTLHHEAILSGDDCLALLPNAIEQLDEPFADPSFLPMLLLTRFASQQVKVALTGDGSDELFAGYDPFLVHRPANLMARLPPGLWRGVQRMVSLWPARETAMSFDFRLKQFLRGVQTLPELRHQTWIGSFDPTELNELLRPDLRSLADPALIYADLLRDVAADRERGLAPQSVEAALRFYFQRYLADDILVKADRASMAVSMELRSPFLDWEVIEAAARLPEWEKLGFTTTKVVLRRMLRDVIPETILERSKKGFGIPVAAWIRGPLRPLFEELFGEKSLRDSELLEPRAARQLLDRHLSGRVDLRKPLWTLAMLLLWQRRWARA